MAITFEGAGAKASGTGNITVGLPSGIQSGDLLLLVCETANQNITVPSPWVQISSSPQGTGTAGGTAATEVHVYYFVADGTETGPTITGTTNHKVAGIGIYRGVDTTALFNAQAGQVNTTANTTCTFPSVTTTVADCLVLLINARALPDSNTDTQTTNHTNANLTGIATDFEYNTNAGNGGGFCVASGLKASAGSTGTSTATNSVNTVTGAITLALTPAPEAQDLTPNLYTNTQTFYGPTVTAGTVTLLPDLYTNTQTFYSPEVTQAGGVQNLDPSLYTNTQTFYQPTVSSTYELTPALYTNTQTFFDPTVAVGTVDLQPSLYTNTQTFYAPTVTAGTTTLAPELFTNAQTFYSATVSATYALEPALYTNEQTFYSATVSQAGSTQTLQPDLYTNSQTFFAITLAATYELSCEDYVDPGYVDPPGYVNWSQINNNLFFTPVVSLGPAPQPTEQFDGDIGPRTRKRRKQREFDDEKSAREELRQTIKAAIEPVKDAAQAAVLSSQRDAEAGVAVVTAGRTVKIVVPPEFNAAQVAAMVSAELEKVNVAVRREQARQALETMVREERARIFRRQREDEEILLLS